MSIRCLTLRPCVSSLSAARTIVSAQFQPAHVPAGQAACCFLPHHTHQCVFCFLPDCLLTFLFFPIRQNGFSLIVQGSFLQPAFVILVHLLYLSFPLLLISGAIYTETFLLTLRAASPLLQSASLSLFLLLSLILVLSFLNNERKGQMRKNSPILKGDIHREAQHFKLS